LTTFNSFTISNTTAGMTGAYSSFTGYMTGGISLMFWCTKSG
jgi:hypothetical protein